MTPALNLPGYRTNLTTLLLMLVGLLMTAPVRAQVNLTVNANQVVRTVDERVFGLNAVIWDGTTSTAQTISLLQSAGVRAVRIPGGSLSDEYHWRTNTNLANTWTWASGFNSFSSLITGINAQAFVTVNYGTGTPEEAAAWVAYANASSSLLGTGADVAIGVDSKGYDWKTAGYWSALRNSAPLGANDGMNFLRIGRASPFGLKYWEIGNECYGTWETDQQSVAHDPYTYAIRSKSYIAKMKSVDSSIKIGVVVVTGEDSSANNTAHPATNPVTGVVHNGWTPVLLTTLKAAPAVTPDYLIFHRYEQAPAADQPGNPETDAGLLQKAKTWPQDSADLRKQLTQYLGGSGAGVELIVTENNSVYAKPGKQTTSLVNGLFLADSIGNILQTEFNGLVWWDLRNGQDNGSGTPPSGANLGSSLYGWRLYGDYGILSSPSSFGSPTAYDPYPTYYVMKLLSNFARGGDTVVQAGSNNSLLSLFAVKRANGYLSLLVINKDRFATQSANITVNGYTSSGAATVYSYGIPQDEAARTSTGSPDLAVTAMSFPSGNFTTSFAPYSATVISFGPGSAPVISSVPAAQTVTAGDSVTFSVAASGQPGPTFQWQKNGIDLGGATASSYTIARVLLGDAGTYRAVATNAVGSATSAGAVLTVQANLPGDFNGDGQTDILWENAGSGDHGLWIMSGPLPVSWINLPSITPNWKIAGVGDFNGDAQTDILWENVGSGDHGIWIMNGTIPAAWINLPSIALSWQIVGTGDFNGDGLVDILWENVGSGDRGMWIMNGTVPAAWINLPSIALNWRIVGTGDFNGDGMADILWENVGSGDRGMWIMNGTVPAAWINLPSIALNWRIAGTGDFNGDGQTDILWENAGSGERGMWIMNGTVPAAWINLPSITLNWQIAQ